MQHRLVVNQMDLDCQAYRPVAVFFNGEYWGIYNIREKLNNYYISSHHDVDPNNLDYIEMDFGNEGVFMVVIEGDMNEFNALLNFLENADMSLTENYSYIKTEIDIDEFINYLITEIYCDNTNWPYTNMRWWKERSETGKWRWVMLDLDFGFAMPEYNDIGGYEHNMFEFLEYYSNSNFQFATFVILKLFENSEFRNEFIQRFAAYLNTTFEENRVTKIISNLKNKIRSEMHRHIERWNFDPSSIPDIRTWSDNVGIMSDFARYRPTYQRQHIIDYFGLSGAAVLTMQTDGGKILINSVAMPEGDFAGIFFKDIPLKVKAVPNVGYRFVRWLGKSSSYADSIALTLTNNATLIALFESSNQTILPAEISKNMVLNIDNSPYLANGDVVVDSNAILQVPPGVEIRMPEGASFYIYGSMQLNGSESAPIYIKPNSGTDAKNWGALCFENSTDSSKLSHVIIEGSTQGNHLDNFIGAISAYNAAISLDFVRIHDAPLPVFTQYSKVKIQNCSFHSDVSGDLINIKYASSALVENCDLRGNNVFDSDAIDYDQIDNGIIRGNRIYNYYGFNSDGIDLGEGTSDVLIEDNLIFNCTDKGISVGQASTAIVKRNIIVNCAQGVGIKDEGSYAYIENNTFYGNDYPVACFEKNLGVGGGSADIVNTILAQSSTASYFVDELSFINISYSLSDTDVLPGESNILANPLFRNNFYLQPNSPAINSGDPNSLTDPDGSLSDIGAYSYNPDDEVFILINEIHFNPPEGEDYEFIELYNSGTSTVDLSGYRFIAGIKFTFPQDAKIDAGEYLVIAKNSSSYGGQGFQWIGEPLSNDWANIQLEDAAGKMVDFVSYDIKDSRVTAANSSGASLELTDPLMENLYIGNWVASYVAGGTPGLPNTSSKVVYINEILAINDTTYADENDEFNDWIELFNDSNTPIDIGGYYVTDDLTDPGKWQIPLTSPDSTTIAPKGYLLLWADGEPNQGVLHLNLKLSGSGEQLGLSQKVEDDYLFIDKLAFGKQSTDVSYGRSPDGSDNWQFFKSPSPNAENQIDIGIAENPAIIKTFFYQNAPNPFNSSTTIKFALKNSEKVKISIYNIRGELVKTLLSRTLGAGEHHVVWRGDNQNGVVVSTGIYFYRVRTANFSETKKMLLLK